MLIVEIPMATPSLNNLLRMHYQVKRRLRLQYERILRCNSRRFHHAKPNEHKRVTIERFGVRHIDQDNFVGGAKPLLDAICNVGLIWDDSPKCVSVSYVQHKSSPKQVRTRVTIC